jgi:hypothetical protein
MTTIGEYQRIFSAIRVRGSAMDIEIHAVDTTNQDSEGHDLAVRGAQLELALRKSDGLPFGEHKDHHYIEVQANSWEDATKSSLIARLYANDLQQLFDFAVAQEMVAAPTAPQIVSLIEQLRDAVEKGKSVRK